MRAVEGHASEMLSASVEQLLAFKEVGFKDLGIGFGSAHLYTGFIIYYTVNEKLKIFSLIELNSDGEKKIIFQTLLLDELIYSNIFMNNYLIFITNEYINSFDFSTFSHYRVKNLYLIKSQKNQNYLDNINIDLVKFGTYPYVFFTYSNEIKFVRIPRNKNLNEEFQLEFIFNEEVSLSHTKLVLKNDFILLNPRQILKIS